MPLPASGESTVLTGSSVPLDSGGLSQLHEFWQLPLVGNSWHVLSSDGRWLVGEKALWGSQRTPRSKSDLGLKTLILSHPWLLLCLWSTTETLGPALPTSMESFASHGNVPRGPFLHYKTKRTPTSAYLRTLKIVGSQHFWLGPPPILVHINKWEEKTH